MHSCWPLTTTLAVSPQILHFGTPQLFRNKIPGAMVHAALVAGALFNAD
jgi:hypothetical protein